MKTESESEPTIFVVDDDRQMRESLVALLHALGYNVRGFGSAAGFLRWYRPHMPGCLVLDVRMPVQDGLSLYEQLLSEGKRLPAVFITAHADVSTAVAAMKSGAVEFLEKPFDHPTLIDRVSKALELDRGWRARDREFRDLHARIAQLNERDRETLELLLAGEPNKVIAARLLLSERAVEMRRASIMRKLQVRSLAELLELAISHRILSELREARID